MWLMGELSTFYPIIEDAHLVLISCSLYNDIRNQIKAESNSIIEAVTYIKINNIDRDPIQ